VVPATSGAVPVAGLTDGDKVLSAVGVRLLDGDGAGTAIRGTTDNGGLAVSVADVLRDVVLVSPGRPVVLPTIRRLFVILVSVCGLGQGSKGGSL
jgi:hypothetical protein